MRGMPIDHAAIKAIQDRHAAAQVSDFQQNLAQDIVGQGMCTGMCLDWVRRILNPKRRMKSRFGEEGRSAFFNAEESAKKKQSRFAKIRKTHDIYSAQASPATNQAVMGEVARVMRSKFKKTEAEFASLDDLISAFPDDEAREAALAFAMGLVKNPQFTTRVATENQDLAFLERFQLFRAAWKEQLKKGFFVKKPRESNFDAIEVAAVREAFYRRGPVDGDTLWSSYLSGQCDKLAAGRVALISCGKTGGMGHELAFHRPDVGTGLYYLDPNFGEYYFKKKGDLGDFFSGIWDEVYFPRGYCRAQVFEFVYTGA